MKILISVKDRAEAEAVLDTGGVDFLDIKNPEEGTLGASKPWIIEEISEIPHGKTKIAASIGDLDYRPGSASLAAYGAASLGVDYITASMFKVRSTDEVRKMSSKLHRTLEEFDTGLIVSGYADHLRCGSSDPFEFLTMVPEADFVMLDTAVKDGKNILDFATAKDLIDLKEKVHKTGQKLIISGSIKYPQLESVREIGADVLGFRGIVCNQGGVKKDLVKKLVRALEK